MEFHKRQSFTLIALVSLFYSSMGFSQSLAVLDTGIDDKHRDLISELLEVEDEVNGIDDDGNGFIDDSYGWNFRDDSRIQTPMKPLPSDYASLIKGMNIIQKRAAGLKVPRTDTLWLRQKTRRRKGAKFFFRLGLVSKFSHGSHVAGIAIKESKTNAEVISLQVLKGADLSPDKKEEDKIPNDYPIENNYTDEEIAKKFEEMVKPDRWQREIKLMRSRGVRVANCSFGLSEAGIVKWLKEFCYEEKIECSAKRKQKLAKLYMKHHRSYTDKALVHANPDILFVIAAGNSRSDNDISPTSPGQFEEDNQIRVAAWDQKNNQIAGFSNYGKTSVELAAPGVGIMSAAPGDKELMMSGTSMAAPYVSAAAIDILKTNPRLSSKEVKSLLLGTVDIVSSLSDKVSTSGLLNPVRALKAAELSMKTSIDKAIVEAHKFIADSPFLSVSLQGDSAKVELSEKEKEMRDNSLMSSFEDID